MQDAHAAWVAGIIDGEGSIIWRQPKSGPSAVVQVKMTDLDILERLRDWTGVGRIYRRPPQEGRKQQWVWMVCDQRGFLCVAAEIEPWLLSRRSEQLRSVRASLLQHRADILERKQWCPSGHDKREVGRTADGSCRSCSRTNTAAWKERERERANAH